MGYSELIRVRRIVCDFARLYRVQPKPVCHLESSIRNNLLISIIWGKTRWWWKYSHVFADGPGFNRVGPSTWHRRNYFGGCHVMKTSNRCMRLTRGSRNTKKNLKRGLDIEPTVNVSTKAKNKMAYYLVWYLEYTCGCRERDNTNIVDLS